MTKRMMQEEECVKWEDEEDEEEEEEEEGCVGRMVLHTLQSLGHRNSQSTDLRCASVECRYRHARQPPTSRFWGREREGSLGSLHRPRNRMALDASSTPTKPKPLAVV